MNYSTIAFMLGLLVSIEARSANPLDTWTKVYSASPPERLTRVAFGGGQFAAVGDIVLTSEDGANWIQGNPGVEWTPPGNLGSEYVLTSLAYGNGRFVAGSFNPLWGDSRIVTFDGTNWTNPWAGSAVVDMAYGQGKFVTARGWMDGSAVLASEDGVNWIEKETGVPCWFWRIAFGNGQFVALESDICNGGNNDQNNVWISSDGADWTQNPLSNIHASRLTFCGGLFVAIASDYDANTRTYRNTVWTSADGMEWTQRLSEVAEYKIYDIAYGNSQFVLACGDHPIISTKDWVEWVPHVVEDQVFIGFDGIAYGNERFIAVGWSGSIWESGSVTVPTENVFPVTKVIAWGDYDQALKRMPLGLTNVIAIASGGFTIGGLVESSESAVLREDGRVIDWAYDPGFWNGATNVYLGVSNVVSLAVAGSDLIALASDGTVHSLRNADLEWPLTNAAAISGNRANAFALKADGTIFDLYQSASLDLSNVVMVAAGGISFAPEAGGTFGLALKDDGTVAAWGVNDLGQTDVPPGLSNIIAVAAGYSHGMALKEDGTVVTWGAWARAHSTPPGLTNVVAIAAAGGGNTDTPEEISGYSLALKADGTVVAWGNGVTNVPPGLSNVVAIAAGPYRALALVGDGPPVTSAAIINPTRDSKGFSCSIPSECGKVYRLEFKDSIGSEDWKASPLMAGNGRGITLMDSSATGQERFYRVRRW